MRLNTYPYNPFPASTDKLDEAHNEQIQEEVDQLSNEINNLDNKIYGDAVTYPYSDVITIDNAVPANLAGCIVKIEPVQSGSGDPSPENVRPISGHTDASVQRDGKNLCDNSTNIIGFYGHDGVYSASSDYKTSALIPVSPNTSYTASVFDTTTNQRVNGLVYTEWDAYGNFIGQTASSVTSIKTTANTKFIRVRNYNSDTTLINSNHYVYQVELGSSATDYEPYAGKTYTIALGDTIYGGTVDFDSGVMTVTMAQIASYDGETIGEPWISDRDVYAAGTTPTTGAQVVYTLATPTTIQLTPQQIQLLKGQNTLTASTGQISVTANGVSGAIGSVQTQANDTDEALAELAADIAEQLPTAPTTDGAYVLTVTVASGTPTYSWESAE